MVFFNAKKNTDFIKIKSWIYYSGVLFQFSIFYNSCCFLSLQELKEVLANNTINAKNLFFFFLTNADPGTKEHAREGELTKKSTLCS